MVTITEKLKKLELLDINRIFDEALKEIEKFILELNREQLYEAGIIDVKEPGKREHYAKGTIRQKIKKAKFKKTEFVTLRWEGDFYDSFELIIFKEKFVIQAKDLKWGNWLEPNPRFGNALGLTEESKNRLRDEILPIIKQKIHNVI
jgi:hypothetical protein